MVENATTGLTLILVAGVLQGSFALPMKYTSKWNWENIWLSYSVMGYLIFPWMIALVTVPQLKEILQQTSRGTLVGTILFGFGWGLGCLTFGLGIDYLGLSLGFAIILGLTAAIGTLIPLLVLSPEKLMSAKGAVLLAGVVTMLVGISLCSWAGKLKETALRAGSSGQDVAPRKSYGWGLVFCVLSGVLSACANLGFAFGSEVTTLATKWGTPQQYASIPLWVVMMLPLFLCNVPFCLYLFMRNQSSAKFQLPGTGRYYLLAASMALMWLVGMLVYGFGANKLGRTGASIGWAILMSSVVIVANLWGLTTREWRGAGRSARSTMGKGLLVLVVAIFIIGGAK